MTETASPSLPFFLSAPRRRAWGQLIGPISTLRRWEARALALHCDGKNLAGRPLPYFIEWRRGLLRASLSSRPAERAQQQAHSVKSSGAVVFKTCFLNAYNFDRAAICNSHTVCCLIFFSVFQDINKKITKRTRREQEKTKAGRRWKLDWLISLWISMRLSLIHYEKNAGITLDCLKGCGNSLKSCGYSTT